MSKLLKCASRMISVFLCVLLVCQLLPSTVMAENIKAYASSKSDSNVESTYHDVNFFSQCHYYQNDRSGLIGFDDFSLKVILGWTDSLLQGLLAPVEIVHQYGFSAYCFMRDEMGHTPSVYGRGMLLNQNSYVCELSYSDQQSVIWFDTETGSHIFSLSSDAITDTETTLYGSCTKWQDSDVSEGYTLYKLNSAHSVSIQGRDVFVSYAVSTPDSVCYWFDQLGRLVVKNNVVTGVGDIIDYVTDGAYEAISSIYDGQGREYRFTYTDGLLSMIKCYDENGAAVTYETNGTSFTYQTTFTYSDGCVTGVTFPDGLTDTYTYDSSYNVTSITNVDLAKVIVEYNNGGLVSRMAKQAYDTDSNIYVTGDYVNVSVTGLLTRQFTDNNGNVQIKTFDDKGRILTIVDGDGNYLYGGEEESTDESTRVTEENTSSINNEETTNEPTTTEATTNEETTLEETTEEETTDILLPHCPCSDCCEPDCPCTCENEESCTCLCCKRRYECTTDEYGNIVNDAYYDGIRRLTSTYTYSAGGKSMTSSVDSAGDTVYYVYNETTGLISSLSSGSSTIAFEHDPMGNITLVSQSVSGLSNGSTMSNSYTYTNNKVTAITHNGFTYHFAYDEWGSETTVSIGDDQILASYTYGSGDNYKRLASVTYANGQTETYRYDDDNNITGISYDGGLTYAYTYTYSNGSLTGITDNRSGTVTTNTDNGTELRKLSDNSLIYSSQKDDNGNTTVIYGGQTIVYTYDSQYNAMTGYTVNAVTEEFSTELTEEGTTSVIDSTVSISSSKDWLSRDKSKSVNSHIAKLNASGEESTAVDISGQYDYNYADTDTAASSKISSLSSTFSNGNRTYSRTDCYEYDERGYITGIFRYIDNTKTYDYNYTYDEAGQLIREDDREDARSIVYVYDVGGNMVSKTTYAYTTGAIDGSMTPVTTQTLGYSDTTWKDILTSYSYTNTADATKNNNCDVISDALGNVTSYNGTTITWTAGRQVASTVNGNDRNEYKYNSNGYLTSVKCYDNTTNAFKNETKYLWEGDKLISKEVDDGSNIHTARVIYDTDSQAQGFVLDGEVPFLYRKDLQGDVTGVVNPVNGEILIEYTYDAYGNPQGHLTNSNDPANIFMAIFVTVFIPQLYRGYTWAAIGNTYCYYLGSRFYVPELGRFLNADSYSDTGTGVVGTNMFAYCNNNPVMFIDPKGEGIDYFLFFRKIKDFFDGPLLSVMNAVTRPILQTYYNKKAIGEIQSLGYFPRSYQGPYYKYNIYRTIDVHGDFKTFYIWYKLILIRTQPGLLLDTEYKLDYQVRSVEEWVRLCSQTLSDWLISNIPYYSVVADFCNTHEVELMALSDVATGDLATIMNIYNTCTAIVDIMDRYISPKSKYVLSKCKPYLDSGKTKEMLIIIDELYRRVGHGSFEKIYSSF